MTVSAALMLYLLRQAASTFQEVINIAFHFLTANYFQSRQLSELKPQTMKKIVILGGSYAGINTAHRILKQAAKVGPIHITLVAPNSHFYWSMASARGIVPD